MAANGIDKALGISPQVLALRMKRMNLLTANIANADTPNYKARDIDFRAALASANASQARMDTTKAGHIALSGTTEQPQVKTFDPSPHTQRLPLMLLNHIPEQVDIKIHVWLYFD